MIYGKNDFAEMFKNYRTLIARISKFFAALFIRLKFLNNYFNGSRKLFLNESN